MKVQRTKILTSQSPGKRSFQRRRVSLHCQMLPRDPILKRMTAVPLTSTKRGRLEG